MEKDNIQQAVILANINLTEIERLSTGSYNSVYKVKEGDKTYILRVFSNPTWPVPETLETINKLLIDNKIPVAKIVYINKENAPFPNGYMIEEFVEGDLAENALRNGITAVELYSKLGKVVRRIHDIKVVNYGYIQNGMGTETSLETFLMKEFDRFVSRIKQLDVLSTQEIEKIQSYLKSSYSLVSTIKPSINQQDISPDNAIMTKEGELVIIDWDHTLFNVWLNDFAIMTYWMRFNIPNIKEREKCIEAFLESYKPDLEIPLIRRVEKAFHLQLILNLLGYYFYDAKSTKQYEDTLLLLKEYMEKYVQ